MQVCVYLLYKLVYRAYLRLRYIIKYMHAISIYTSNSLNVVRRSGHVALRPQSILNNYPVINRKSQNVIKLIDKFAESECYLFARRIGNLPCNFFHSLKYFKDFSFETSLPSYYLASEQFHSEILLGQEPQLI